MKCLSKLATHTYEISNRMYKSVFDCEYTKFQLCDDCHKDEYDHWVNEEPYVINSYNYYKFESNILNFINSLPIESQELFFNTFAVKYECLPQQTWIDYKLNLLSYTECKQYGLISMEEKKAYKHFERCNKVTLTIDIKDGISYSQCNNYDYLFTIGDKNGKCFNEYSYNPKCYICKNYKKRKNNIKINIMTRSSIKNNIYRLNDFIVTDYYYHSNNISTLVFGDDNLLKVVQLIKQLDTINFNIINLKRSKHLLIIHFNDCDDLIKIIIKGFIKGV